MLECIEDLWQGPHEAYHIVVIEKVCLLLALSKRIIDIVSRSFCNH